MAMSSPQPYGFIRKAAVQNLSGRLDAPMRRRCLPLLGVVLIPRLGNGELPYSCQSFSCLHPFFPQDTFLIPWLVVVPQSRDPACRLLERLAPSCDQGTFHCHHGGIASRFGHSQKDPILCMGVLSRPVYETPFEIPFPDPCSCPGGLWWRRIRRGRCPNGP